MPTKTGLYTLIDYLTSAKVNRGSLIEKKVEKSSRHRTRFKKHIRIVPQDAPRSPNNPLKLQPTERRLSFQEAVDGFIRRAADVSPEILRQKVGNDEKLYFALMTAIAYAKVPELNMQNFMDSVVLPLTFHDSVPVFADDDYQSQLEAQIVFAEVFDLIFDKSYDLFTGFDHMAYAAKRDGISQGTQLLRFVQSIGGEKNVRLFLPSSIEIYPGPGIVINGLHKKVFPDQFLQKQFETTISENDDATQRVNKKYRNLLVQSETDLPKTTFGFFRGVIIVSNENMTIDGRRYDLAIFNDHFKNQKYKMAYLVPHKETMRFMNSPLEALQQGNPCSPENIDNDPKNLLISLNTPSVIGGLDKGLPVEGVFFRNSLFYDRDGEIHKSDLLEYERRLKNEDETRDINGHIHRTHMFSDYWSDGFPILNLIPFRRAHNEITLCASKGFALLDLFKEAFRLYNYGYDYNTSPNNVDMPQYLRLLDQSIDWYQSGRTKNKPILVPLRRLRWSGFDTDLLREVGAIDTKTQACYQTKSNGGSYMLPSEHFEDLDGETRSKYLKFLTAAYKNRADLVFMAGDEIRAYVRDTLK